MKANIITIPGDGIGPEVVAEAVRLLDIIANKFGHEFKYSEQLMGGCSIDKHGVALTDEALADCKASDAVLLGAVGGPKWDDPNAKVRPEQGILALRKGLGVFANLRPAKPHPALFDSSPLKPEKLKGVDVLVIRELTGGLYFGHKAREKVNGHTRAIDTLEYHDYEVERVVNLAFRLAAGRRKKVSSVDKANILESGRLWRQIASGIAAEHPDITFEHVLVDTAAMRLVNAPASFDVLVTENMFGDILTDEASMLAGSLGLLPSASLGAALNSIGQPRGLYEPIHGSAPDIAGQDVANPLATILSVALLLRYSLAQPQAAEGVENAVASVLAEGLRTADIQQPGTRQVGCREMGAAVLCHLE